MAWIRRVRTASGATAVQVAESARGKRVIVAHVGSAHDEVELGLLMEQARLLLHDGDQGVLDLGVEVGAPRVELAGRASDALLDESVPGCPSVVPTPRVVSTSSGLLFDVVGGVYDDLGFDCVDDGVFRELVVARVIEPTSLLDWAVSSLRVVKTLFFLVSYAACLATL